MEPAVERAPRILSRLYSAYPNATCALTHQDPWQLLVATILSAQCTDKRVNMVTPELFARYPTPDAVAAAEQEELESIIHSTGFYHAKARHLRASASIIAEEHGGRVPDNMEELLKLPGVARKTANVVLGTGYGIAVGVVVDTHVFRISRRLGLSAGRSPSIVERDLIRVVPRDEWIMYSHLLIHHGRAVCMARKPTCKGCTLTDLCPSAFFSESRTKDLHVSLKAAPSKGKD
ncbi:MAG: endonuclease III [Candidatus Undinarchaeales archaeon]|jgi:endonuclease-3|nr:endonuclease III [Candidatus Undinarchaeales archaeon]MDP7492821.1 endonuclease III [Candidatus Undinarchaeales archaeon]